MRLLPRPTTFFDFASTIVNRYLGRGGFGGCEYVVEGLEAEGRDVMLELFRESSRNSSLAQHAALVSACKENLQLLLHSIYGRYKAFI